eukprot:scaffold211099_cov20-Cyclotella_meneghiniana.AAC.1
MALMPVTGSAMRRWTDRDDMQINKTDGMHVLRLLSHLDYPPRQQILLIRCHPTYNTAFT